MSKRAVIQELHKPARRNYPRRRVITKGIDDLWQCDLVEMIPYARKNKGYKYLLTVIDTFSKYAWVRPVKTKSAADVTRAMSNVLLQSSKRYPKNLQSDHGKEFYNTTFKSLMKKHGINHYSTYSTLKASIVERFNRTLKEHMWREFSVNGTYAWLKILPQLISEYNHRIHRTIKMRPVDVTHDKEKHLLNTVYSNIKIVGPAKFKIGQHVRISKIKSVFDKGYTANWSTEIFTISKVQITNPVTYKLEDLQGHPISGGFYEHELQPTQYPDIYLVEKVLRRKGSKVFVRWLGLDKSHDSWIDKKNVVL